MRRRPAGRLAVCLFGLLIPFCSQASDSDAAIWKGTSGKYAIEWSASALRATRSDTNQIAFDARAEAQAEWSRIVQTSPGARLKAEFTYRLLSAAGPYLSIEEGEYCDCGGAHPTAVKKFRTIALDRSTADSPQAASLRELFPPQEIFKALVSDSAVHKALGSDAVPASLNELLDRLIDQTVRVGECEYRFPQSLMASFAFYEISEDRILVRLGLPSAVESCRGQLTQLGLTLAPSEAIRVLFLGANRQHEGLLMMDEERLMRSGVTSFSFTQAARR
jgi:hypothetical protein